MDKCFAQFARFSFDLWGLYMYLSQLAIDIALYSQ